MRAPVLRLALLAAALLSAAALAGCGRDPARPSFVRETTLFGTLYVGEPLVAANAITLGETRPVDAPYDLDEALVSGALVTLWAEGSAQPETLAMVAPGRYANPSVVILPHTTYHLSATKGAIAVTATTTTPGPLTMLAQPVALPDSMRWNDVAALHPMLFDGSDPTQLMLVDVYCHEPWQTARYVYPIGQQDTPANESEYGGANDEPRHIAAYFRLADLGPKLGGAYRLGFYGDMMAFYGTYTVGLFAIDQNEYEYLYRDHPERHGGVTGGIGLFASAWRRQWRVRVVP